MEIMYASPKLEKILTNPRLIKKNYTAIHTKISNRLSELRAANNLNEIPHVPPPRRHKLSGSHQGCWGVDVSKNFRIILRPIGNNEESVLDTIRTIEILAIEDYH
ncbi:type II toxin-antitoxin system RelE/ParE family toxin [Alkalihalobacillus macyae]|uniref:type II toxin-antitoxin system RelE/ParE family toxin n=1 Tax=Guptibacillus hwajinpoensis TaxID=208199 RepID=UPI00273BE9A2|nr:type II toxin-antitoxin system RelE/ParE family toxin [Alkalihalobacillus macyae]MDP4553572.1 type II toxin-antitoxin system RelE/ParE family toxin [Alkalihalobacillus macyae]